MGVDFKRLRSACDTARQALLARREPSGHWVGQLANSALSTATAVSALAIVERHAATDRSGGFADESAEAQLSELIVGGLRWLADRQNPDGGWGDTDRSLSNIATTLLVKAAFHLTGVPADHADLLQRADAYIELKGGIPGLRRRYGKDKTFAVPILTNCALAGFVPWKEISPLPFELVCLPQHWFRFLKLPVVSYAIPALVAIGQARFFHRKPLNPIVRLLRSAAVERSLRVLEEIQPDSGGYLEAAPLTSFVVMSLASIGQADHSVTRRGVKFLIESVREDGSWPIDTNLATWNTTLAINALASGALANGENPQTENPLADSRCLDWLLSCQHCHEHPYSGADPGGWAWTDLSGGVPDADDTSGALLALSNWQEASSAEKRPADPRVPKAAAEGIRWLLDLQNNNGGWPTFSRGWGVMPFDRSAADLTAHAIRALHAWQNRRSASADLEGDPLGGIDGAAIDGALERGFRFLAKSQKKDGSWSPLWFGNQYHPGEENPIYGTARVLLAYRDLDRLSSAEARRGCQWLAAHQNPDGGWGGAAFGSQSPPKRAGRRRNGSLSGGSLSGGSLSGFNGARRNGSGPSAAESHASASHRKESDIHHPQSTVEETAVALEALLATTDSRSFCPAANEGLRWLVDSVESNDFINCSPIGFYFAKLWYYEKLYPLVFTVSALGQALRQSDRESDSKPDQPRPVAINL